MKKVAIAILSIGIVLIISAVVISFISPDKVEKKEYKDIEWEEAYGDKILTNYQTYKNDELKEYKYNLKTYKDKTGFSIALPKNIELHMMDTDFIEYQNDDIFINITKTMSAGIDSEIERIIDNTAALYEKAYLQKTTYDKNIFAIIFENGKYSEDKTKMHFTQEIRIYIKINNNNNEYVLIQLKAYDKRVDLEMISKIINSISINKNMIEFCDNKKCEADLSIIHEDLKNKFNLELDDNKYVLESNNGINIFNANFITKAYQEVITDEENAPKKLTRISLRLSYNNESLISNIPNQEEIEVDGKKVLCSYEEEDLEGITKYKGTYIYKADNNLLVVITIDSRLNNVEEVLKDFIKFEI